MNGNSGDGVFQHLIDRAAFVDRVEISIWGTRRRRTTTEDICLKPSFPVGGPRRLYARAANGFCPASGNKFQVRYGVMRRFRRVPPYRLILYSNQTPVSYAQVALIVRALMWQGCRVQVSKVEVTFDLSEVPVEFFIRHVQTQARQTRQFRDQFGQRTYYVGGATSRWQLRVYSKTELVTRFEFIFRLDFLRKVGIRHPHELIFLRRVDLRRLVWLREVDRSKLPRASVENFRTRALHELARSLTATQFWEAAKDYGAERSEWFRPCPIERRLQRMQGWLVW